MQTSVEIVQFLLEVLLIFNILIEFFKFFG